MNELNHYMRYAKSVPLLTKAQELELARAYQSGDAQAGQQLVEGNLRFVVKLAHKYIRYYEELSDLVQQGNIGLLCAAKKFDPDRGLKFITYAVFWIKHYILYYIRNTENMVNPGKGKRRVEAMRKLPAAEAKLMAQHGEASNADIAAEIDLPEHVVESVRNRIRAHDQSIDTILNADGITYLGMLTDDTASSPEEIVALRERVETLHKTIGQMNWGAREHYILRNRMLAQEPMTCRDVGSYLGVSRQRVGKIEKRMIRSLRKVMAE